MEEQLADRGLGASAVTLHPLRHLVRTVSINTVVQQTRSVAISCLYASSRVTLAENIKEFLSRGIATHAVMH